MLRRINNNWKNPLGIILAITHAIVLSFLIMEKEPSPLPVPPSPDEKPCQPDKICFDFGSIQGAGISYIADREIHLYYERPILKFFIIADLPAFIIGAIVSLPLQLLTLSKLQASYLAGAIWIISGSIEWWVIGVLITKAIRIKKI